MMSRLAMLCIALALAVGACGHYGPPLREEAAVRSDPPAPSETEDEENPDREAR